METGFPFRERDERGASSRSNSKAGPMVKPVLTALEGPLARTHILAQA
jgi:hypothetical protein